MKTKFTKIIFYGYLVVFAMISISGLGYYLDSLNPTVIQVCRNGCDTDVHLVEQHVQESIEIWSLTIDNSHDIPINAKNLFLDYIRAETNNNKILMYVSIGDPTKNSSVEFTFPTKAVGEIFNDPTCDYDATQESSEFLVHVNQNMQDTINTVVIDNDIILSMALPPDSSVVEIFSLCSSVIKYEKDLANPIPHRNTWDDKKEKSENLPDKQFMKKEDRYQDCPVSFMYVEKQDLPQHDPDIIVEPEPLITAWGQSFSSYEEALDVTNIHDIHLPTYMPQCLKVNSIRATTGTLGGTFLTITYQLEDMDPAEYNTLTDAREQGLTIQIREDRNFVYQYDEDYVKTQVSENKGMGWNYTLVENFPVLLKDRDAEHNIPSEIETLIKHQTIKVRSSILEIDELEKIFRSMFEEQ